MKIVWQLLVRFLGIYIATFTLFLIPICLIVFGIKWAFTLEKVMSSDGILEISGIPKYLEGIVIKDECYYYIDGHGCEFIKRFSEEETQKIQKIVDGKHPTKGIAKSLIKDKSNNHLVFTKELYRLDSYPVDMTVSWDGLNREVSYKELNGQWTKSLDLLRLFELISAGVISSKARFGLFC